MKTREMGVGGTGRGSRCRNGKKLRIGGTPATNTKKAAEHAERLHVLRVTSPGVLSESASLPASAPGASRKEVPTVREHSLRHSFGTDCARRGVPLATLKELMGREKIETTCATSRSATPPSTKRSPERLGNRWATNPPSVPNYLKFKATPTGFEFGST